MLAAHDVANRIYRRLNDLSISSNFFADLTGTSRGQMSGYLSGAKKLQNGEGERLEAVAKSLDQLAKKCGPIPVAFKDVDVIRELLKKLAAGFLQNEIKDISEREIFTAGKDALGGIFLNDRNRNDNEPGNIGDSASAEGADLSAGASGDSGNRA